MSALAIKSKEIDVDSFLAEVRKEINYPHTLPERYTLQSLPYFKKYESPHLPPLMALCDWWDAFNEYMANTND